MSTCTQDVIEHHLDAFFQDIEHVMEDFTEESVVVTSDGAYRGRAQIRSFFSALLGSLPEGFEKTVRINRRELVGDIAFLLWEAKPWFPFCTDTCVVRDGEIAYQTYAAYQP